MTKNGIVREKMDHFLDIWKTAMRRGDDRREIVQKRKDFIQLRNEYFKSTNKKNDKKLLKNMDDMIVELNNLYGENK